MNNPFGVDIVDPFQNLHKHEVNQSQIDIAVLVHYIGIQTHSITELHLNVKINTLLIRILLVLLDNFFRLFGIPKVDT